MSRARELRPGTIWKGESGLRYRVVGLNENGLVELSAVRDGGTVPDKLGLEVRPSELRAYFTLQPPEAA